MKSKSEVMCEIISEWSKALESEEVKNNPSLVIPIGFHFTLQLSMVNSQKESCNFECGGLVPGNNIDTI